MKFEKINDDKIKITLSSADLEANDLDLHSFMSDSSETQSLFLILKNRKTKDGWTDKDNFKSSFSFILLMLNSLYASQDVISSHSYEFTA